MGVSKEPVCILTLSPNPICLGSAMAWDFTGSYAPGSTITSRDINFGDSNTDSGVSGTHTYGAAGTYTVTATVTEGGGTAQTVTQEVNVIDCSDSLLLNNIYSFTNGSGVYYWEDGTWVARNNGLTGTALNVHFGVQEPKTKFLNSTSHELLIATDNGIYHSINGGRAWAKITLPDPSNAEFADAPAATVDELTFHWVDYDPTDDIINYVLAIKSSVNRQWLYKSSDNLLTWISRGIVTI